MQIRRRKENEEDDEDDPEETQNEGVNVKESEVVDLEEEHSDENSAKCVAIGRHGVRRGGPEGR